ncbi:MAG: hypothetical protein Q4G14_14470, partial [Paracoccus sp. (in: a-proteobacteria)]|uniref:hypothetical protein n=1 Tax=Paracoccus sp. TaxID=267 RepID=UPI0026E10668
VITTLAALVSALPLILADATGFYRTHMPLLKELLEPVGGIETVALTLLVIGCLVSAVQHLRAGAATTDDYHSGRTL